MVPKGNRNLRGFFVSSWSCSSAEADAQSPFHHNQGPLVASHAPERQVASRTMKRNARALCAIVSSWLSIAGLLPFFSLRLAERKWITCWGYAHSTGLKQRRRRCFRGDFLLLLQSCVAVQSPGHIFRDSIS